MATDSPGARPVVLVTGGGTGVGRACILRFARLGFDCVINYSRSEADALATAAEAAGLGAQAVSHRADVSDEQQVQQMMEGIAQRFGRLDVLVNNAAVTEFIPLEDLDAMEEPTWDKILGVNLKGAFFCAKWSRSLLEKHPPTAIVNVSSVAGLTGRGSSIAYAASKGALNTMTKSLAQALAPKIRVNAVLPGPIDSRWIREGANDWDLEEMTRGFPIPRPSTPDDIAAGVVFLAVETEMTTGQLLTIDGGQTL
ncbi:MAG: SDR family oxidoreductase [Planctomycetota bacterium]|nr:MAG: SDR family oxidoreductase [Planctomycetota bacterium]